MNNRPVRLHKKMTIQEQLNEWVWRNLHILLPILFIMLTILFVLVCYAIVGVSATDSGVTYNQFERII